MKRLGADLFKNICSIENLKNAHLNARKGKTHYKEVKYVDENLDFCLNIIKYNLESKNYNVSNYKNKVIIDKTKEREIFILPYFPDRIIQWAIMLQIRDRIEKTLILDTYASIPNRGILFGTNRVSKFIKNNKYDYYLKFDIKKFYPSINKEVLKNKVANLIKCNDTLNLIFKIIDSCENGIPIGNYLSQYLANLYLSELDHYCKEDLKCNGYFRYMDDVVIIGDKEFLKDCFDKINVFISKEKLIIKSNYRVSIISKEGLDFMGYRHFGNRVILRKRIYKNIRKMSPKNKSSYYGWIKHSTCHKLKEKYFMEMIK